MTQSGSDLPAEHDVQMRRALQEFVLCSPVELLLSAKQIIRLVI